MSKQMKKADLIKVLVDEYGYEASDLKTETNAKLQAMIDREVSDALEVEKSKTYEVAKEPSFKDEDLILVMCGKEGSHTHKGRNGRIWKFREYGQQDRIPYGELITMKNVCPKVLEDGYLVVLNPEVAELLGLTNIYENIILPQNIEEVFNKNVEELGVFIDNLPEGMKVTFVSKARQLYSQKKLYDMRIIELIQSKFGFSLEDNAPLSDSIKFKG